MDLIIFLSLLFLIALLLTLAWVWRIIPALVEDQEEFERAMASLRELTTEP